MIYNTVFFIFLFAIFPSQSKDLKQYNSGLLKQFHSDLNSNIKSGSFPDQSESGFVSILRPQLEDGGGTDFDKVEMRLLSRARDCGMILSKCVRDSDCCTGYCQPMLGHCLFNPLHHQEAVEECRPNLHECLFNYQCCSKKCDPVTGKCLDEYVTLHPPVATSQQSCSLEAGTCQVDYHCCSNLCNTTSGTCMANSKKDAHQRVHLKSGSAKLIQRVPENLVEREKIITATEVVQKISQGEETKTGFQERLFEKDVKDSQSEQVYKKR